jgi:glucose-1-phosphate thymidylyltransferase
VQDSLSGPAVIAYADTLIRADFLDPQADAVIWVKQVDQKLWSSKIKRNK